MKDETGKEIVKYEKNPFLKELNGKMFIQPRANMVIAKDEKLINTETGEIMKDATLIGRQKLVDKSQFTKIYASELGKIMELKKGAIAVFIYLTKVMDYNNRAFFYYSKDFKKIGYKTHLIPLKGLKELLNKEIIAMDVRPFHFWMNPRYVCKGERFAIYTEYIKDEKAGTYGEAVKNIMGEKNANKQLPLFSSDNEKIDPYANEKKEKEPELSNENKTPKNEAQEKE